MGTETEKPPSETRTSEENRPAARKPGPVPGVPTRKFNVMIEESLAEWAKSQPGGLSDMVRRLLKAERNKCESHDNDTNHKTSGETDHE